MNTSGRDMVSSYQRSAFSYQQSAISNQQSAISYQLSVPGLGLGSLSAES
jgi:hypothetical protein